MKAISGPSAHREALLKEYRVTLRMWSEAKVLYPLESEEFAQIASNLDSLEQSLFLTEIQAGRQLKVKDQATE